MEQLLMIMQTTKTDKPTENRKDGRALFSLDLSKSSQLARSLEHLIMESMGSMDIQMAQSPGKRRRKRLHPKLPKRTPNGTTRKIQSIM
jgi:hypothetical protein